MTNKKVKLIVGSHGAGKSEYLFRKFFDVAYKDGKMDLSKKLYLVVPEQDTNDKQRKMMHKAKEYIGTTGILNIDVTSFTRIAHDVFDKLNIELDREKVLEDDAKTMLLTCLISKINSDKTNGLKFYKNSAKKVGFAKKFTEVVSEFYAYNIKNEDLDKIINNEKNSSYKDKITDLKTIYNSFTSFLKEKGYKINEDRYNLLAETIDKTNIFDDAIVAFDGFTGFTPVQLQIFDKIKAKSAEVYVTIDSRDIETIRKKITIENDVFYLSEKFAKDIKFDEIIDLSNEKPKYKNKFDLSHVENALYNYHISDRVLDKEPQNIELYVADNIHDEILNTINIIFNLLKKGYKYRDIKVIVPNISDYMDKLIAEFGKNNIPIFIDDTSTILNSPYIETIRAALDVVNYDFSYDSIMRYISSGIIEKNDEINSFDNTIREYGIRGHKRYKDKFGNNELFIPLINLYEYIKKPLKISQYVEFINKFIEESELNNKYDVFINLFKERYKDDHDYNRQIKILGESHEVLNKSIKSLLMVANVYDDTLTIEEFKNMLDVGLTDKGIKSIPFGLDQVVVGDVMRSRFDNPKVQIFMGLNQSRFPKSTNDESLINDKMRELFKNNNVELSQTTMETALNQRFYTYLIFTNPTDKLFLSYTKQNADGASDLESLVIVELKHLFNKKLTEKYVKTSNFSFVVKDKFNITKIDKQDNVNPLLIDAIINYGDKKRDISPTTIESYNTCPFKHFYNRTLKLEERKEYGISGLEFGNFVHSVFENIFRKYDLKTLDDEQLKNIVIEELEIAFKNEKKFAEMNDEDYFGINKISIVKNNCIGVMLESVKILREFAKKSKFEKPIVEDKIDSFDFGGIKIHGRTDKVETCTDIGENGTNFYVSVSDYKSGSKQKKIDIKEINKGVSVQLVLYLDYYLEKIYKDKNPIPCGSFYFWVASAYENALGKKDSSNPITITKKKIENAKVPKCFNGIFGDKTSLLGIDKPQGKQLTNEEFNELIKNVKKITAETKENIMNGVIEAKPYDNNICKYCEYKNLCNVNNEYDEEDE